MTVLVTGGAGYIGSHAVHDLIDGGDRVVVLDNLSTGFLTALPASAIVVAGDCGDQRLVATLIDTHQVQAIIHFAGSVVVPESVRDPLGYYRNNTINSRNLIETAIQAGVRHFIFSSTAAVYGNPEQNPVSEQATLAPLTPYGWSKLMTEVMLRDAAAAHGLAYVTLRYFNVAGADPKQRTGQSTHNATHLIKVAVQTTLGVRPQLDVYGTDYPTPDGTCVRDYIHVSDLARAHRAALVYLRGGGNSTVLNCGYGRGYSVLEVADAVRRVSGTDFPVRMVGRRPGDPAAIVADASLIRDVFDWAPQFENLDTIVSHALTWERRLMSEGRQTLQKSYRG